jgi:hypothetical protein
MVMLLISACSLQPEADAAPAQQAKQSGKVNQCRFQAWSTDPDPNGLNVRAGPSKAAKIVGTIPPAKHNEDFDRKMATEFDVVEAQNGWFRIEKAAEWSDGSTVPTKLASGWISGRFIGFTLQTEVGFAAPNPESARLFESRQWGGPDNMRGITDCKGEWVKISYGLVAAPKQAWFRGVCGNQETSCDGVQGDESGLNPEAE